MYNETLRKITSLSLLTILLTSTAAFAMPNALPQAHAATNANLFVSAENSQFNNYFSGPQVIQVVVADPNINRLDQLYGEPTVTINGKRLRMAQATDGNWYAYFADRNQAQQASATSAVNGTGLNFGLFCASTSTLSPKGGVNYAETKGFTIARDVGSATAGQILAVNKTTPAVGSFTTPNCVTPAAFSNAGKYQHLGTAGPPSIFTVATIEHVVRQNKTLNQVGAGFNAGQLYAGIWPVIQLYDFSSIPSPVTVDYQKSGGDQIVNLTFDRIPTSLISSSVDRTAYPVNSQVFVTINDPQLNVDPTEEDSWTWAANATSNKLFYMAFNRNGIADADGNVTAGKQAMQNLIGNLTLFNFNHNGRLTINPAAQSNNVIDFQKNGKQVLTSTDGTGRGQTGGSNPVRTASIGINSAPVTFIESGGVNNGVFVTYDGSKKSDLVTTNSMTIRGQSATIRYNDVSTSIVGGFGFATLSITATNNTWAGGQKIPVTLVDSDQNTNSKITQHLDLFNPAIYNQPTGGVPTTTIGIPYSLTQTTPTTASTSSLTANNATFVNGTHTGTKIASTAGLGSGLSALNFNRPPGLPATTRLNVTTTTLMADINGIQHVLLVTPCLPGSSIASCSPQSAGSGGSGIGVTGPNTFGGNSSIALIIDTNQTMATLKKTIHSTLKNDTESFRGFNFINYDLRSLGSVGNTTGAISKINIYLVYKPAAAIANGTTILDPHTHGLQSGLRAISIANSTNLQDFINLNGTLPLTSIGANVDKHGSFTTPGKVDNGTLIAYNLFHKVPNTATVGLMFNFTLGPRTIFDGLSQKPIVADFFSVGIKGDGITNDQRVNNAIYRFELEETGANSGAFTGTTEYVMLNQLNIFDPNTYSTLRVINNQVKFVAITDMLQSQSRAPQVSYTDLGADGQFSIVSAQQDVPTHTGVVSFDSKTYKIADTVTITLNDADLNVNTDLVDIYTVVRPANVVGTNAVPPVTTIRNEDAASDAVGKPGLGNYTSGASFGRLLDIQFGQQNGRWANTACFGTAPSTAAGFNLGLFDTGFTLVETGPATGIFTGTFEIPDQICDNSNPTTSSVSTVISAVGLNIKVNYVDFRDESGKRIEVSDNAGIRGNTGSITLDKSVYPVPFGSFVTTASGLKSDFIGTPSTSIRSLNGIFPLHRDNTGNGLGSTVTPNTLTNGDTLVHIRVNDQDYNISAAGTDHIQIGIARGTDNTHGPVWAVISRQGVNTLLTFAGGPNIITTNAKIKTAPASPTAPTGADAAGARDLGPMTEISPSSGIFQADLPIRFTDGPAANDCPIPTNYQGVNGTYAGISTFINPQTDRFDAKATTTT